MTSPSEKFKVPDTCKKVEIFPVPPETGRNYDFLSKVGIALGGHAICSRDERGGDHKLIIERNDSAPLSEYARLQLEDLAKSREDMKILFL
jgi:hypothetical protein